MNIRIDKIATHQGHRFEVVRTIDGIPLVVVDYPTLREARKVADALRDSYSVGYREATEGVRPRYDWVTGLLWFTAGFVVSSLIAVGVIFR